MVRGWSRRPVAAVAVLGLLAGGLDVAAGSAGRAHAATVDSYSQAVLE